MAKLKNPLLSLRAAGQITKHFVIRRRQNLSILENKPIPKDAKSPAQLSWRHMYQKAIALWNALSQAEKQEWESLARPKHMTGQAWFISQALKPNPGLYLPLQGGTMSGDIDMAKHRNLRLPTPVDDQEVATKKYVDDAIAGIIAGTKEFWVPITYGTLMASYGGFPVVKLKEINDRGYISFYVPHDFTSITTAVVIVRPGVTEVAANWDINSYYGAEGESYTNHAESNMATTYNVTENQLFAIDISGILSSLAANDYVGIRVNLGNGAHDVDIIGIRFRYS